MTKKKVWIAGTVVLLLLLVCTVLSLRIEKWMRIEVEAVIPVQGKEEEIAQEARIPLSCYRTDDSSSVFFYLEERDGLFGKEMTAVETENWALREEDDMAVINSSQGKDSSGGWLQIVKKSTYPLKDGDVVKVGMTKNPKEKMKEQEKILFCLAALILVGIPLLAKSVRMIGALQDGEQQRGIKGVAIAAAWLFLLYAVTGQLDIPRVYLPPESILDVGFYW